jgi:hypothetical protein
MRNAALVLLLALAAPTLGGCSALSYMTEMTFRVFTPPPTTTPLFSLDGKNVLILVDTGRQELDEAQPRLKYEVAKALANELGGKHAAWSFVNPLDLEVFSKSHSDYSRLSVVEIGQSFKVDWVLHVIVEDYHLEATAAAENYVGLAVVGLRVIDVKTGEQLFPNLNGEQLVEARSPTVIAASSIRAAEKILNEGLALNVGKVFVPYVIEKLPMRPEVK